MCRWCATYRLKALDKGYNFSLYLIAIRDSHKKLCALKVAKVLIVGILGLPFGSLGTKRPFGRGPRGKAQNIL
jgi:hypothetical protein